VLPQEIIRRKRDGGELARDDIAAFIAALTDGRVTDGQAAALAMAVFFRGMTRAETVALTEAMRDSGTVLDWRRQALPGPPLPGPVLDKHSTGGIGDKVSLILAPLVAACGGFVPMLSGRGLGHTGGTLDKLAAIPGYLIQPDRERFVRVVREVGCAVVGATDDLAPADRRLYAIRDVTATVESLPLITASILAKKLAEGAQGLVMDVKAGSGAFMASEDDARALARSLVEVAHGAGVPTVALITDMDQALGHTVGNALEVVESIDFLTGAARDARLAEVTLSLVAEMLVLGGLAADLGAARRLAEARLADGAAAERFARMVAALGGPRDLLETPARHLAAAPHVVAVMPEAEGFVAGMDAREIGVVVVELGGGRTRHDAAIDHRVGLSEVAGIGSEVGASRPICMVHAADPSAAECAAARVRAAVRVSDAVPEVPAVVRERIALG